MTPPTPVPGLPDDDTIVSTLGTTMTPQLQAPEIIQELPWVNVVWLAPDACLMQSHVPKADPDLVPVPGHPHSDHPHPGAIVIQVVGTSDCGDWAGAVLLLG